MIECSLFTLVHLPLNIEIASYLHSMHLAVKEVVSAALILAVVDLEELFFYVLAVELCFASNVIEFRNILFKNIRRVTFNKILDQLFIEQTLEPSLLCPPSDDCCLEN